MPDFKELQNQLQQARAGKEQARVELFEARERVKRIEAGIARQDRTFNPDDPRRVSPRRTLEQMKAEAEAAVKERERLYGQTLETERRLFATFSQFSDPREQIKRLSDAFPFLMLPIRIETRFKTLTANGQQHYQLWARVYPDDCMIDSFEATLSESEISAARLFWIEMWKAGGVEAQQRVAWRGLAANFGRGRAAWIMRQYRPLNAEPFKGKNENVILVIPTETPLTSVEASSTAAFWKAVWLADGDRSKEDAARTRLEAAVGGAPAAEIIERYRPANLAEKPATPLKKSDVASSVEFLVLPKPEDMAVKRLSWAQAAKVNALPDRFVFIGYSGGQRVFEIMGNQIRLPLTAGPDPLAAPNEQIKQKDGEFIVSDEMRWMTDFDRAIEWGMGIKIDLSRSQSRTGFDRLLAVGVRLSADEIESKKLIESLIDNHFYGGAGFSLIPQGAPTNNTESGEGLQNGGAGFSRSEDPDDGFDHFFKRRPRFEDSGEWFERRDGQWLADYLGIDPAALRKAPHAEGRDQCEARAMNVALWPATFGYWMETMMSPLFNESDVETARWFFTSFVSGRGALPTVRIGAQPYGILPTTAFSRIKWISSNGFKSIPGVESPQRASQFLMRLQGILQRMDADWKVMSNEVSFVGKPGDAHKTLLDIVGLHSGSVEYYQRYAESLQQLFNHVNLERFGGALVAALIAAGYTSSGLQLLQQIGATGRATPDTPDILKKFFLTSQNLLRGPIIDDRPLSEIEPIRGYTDDNRNYIRWLIDAAKTSLETLRQQSGFTGEKAPNALLYLMLRHALMEGYWDADLRLRLEAGISTEANVKALRREPAFIHVKEDFGASESRWNHLYKAEPRITDNPSQPVYQFIPNVIGARPATRYLDQQIKALERLKDAPTARLERVLAEHIDCCSYRLDAWQSGLVNYQLAAMRYQSQTVEGELRITARQGLYIGAYGWLEEVRPEDKQLVPARLDPKLDQVFNQNPKDPPLMRDNTNGGYIHAPSLNHAVTAAVLRNGYLSNATPSNPQTLAVNLSSERVRLALSILEGVRGGQPLGALLGYRFERGLHDRHNLSMGPMGPEVDEFIFKLRREFPLRAGRITTTKEDDEAIEAIEARNVMDGLSLINHIKNTGNKNYPFGKPLPAATPAQAAAIDAEVDRLLDIHDAVADLAMAEGAHQAVQGNFDRVAATLETFSKGNFPPEPDVVRTPRSGAALTHRVGLQLESGLDSGASPVPDIAMTPRAKAEPAINKWLAAMLPAPADAGCKARFFDPATETMVEREVTQKDLELQPIDLLYLLQADSQQAMAELDDRVLKHVIQTFNLRPDRVVTIHYTDRLPGNKISFFELAPLIDSLRSIALRSRPLQPTDIALHEEAEQKQDESVFVDKARIVAVKSGLETLHPLLVNFHTPLDALFADMEEIRARIDALQVDPETNRDQINELLIDLAGDLDQIFANVDDFVDQIVSLLSTASLHAIPQTGWGFAFEAKRRAYTELLKKIDELVERWEDRLDECNQIIDAYNALPIETSNQEKFDLLRKAERILFTKPVSPAPDIPSDLLDAIDLQLAAFGAKLNEFKEVLDTAGSSLALLLDDVKVLLPVDDFDFEGIEVREIERRILTLTADVAVVAKSVAKEVDRRIKAADERLLVHDNAALASARAEALEAAAKILLGEDFQIVPEFDPTDEQADEWEKALGASGDLLNYLTGDLKHDFPVDDWLYGVARVREKMRHWEQAVIFAEAFGKDEAALDPIQLPFKEQDCWLALRFPEKCKPDGERLLYTAHYAAPFQKAARQCGLLIDEWTEIIPATEETTGVAFHYDRPNSEPPQTMLLVTSPDFLGSWDWGNLVAALNETLDWAKRRAVEPVHVDATAYARFLPATITPATLFPISIALSYAANNNVHQFLNEENNG